MESEVVKEESEPEVSYESFKPVFVSKKDRVTDRKGLKMTSK